MLADERIATAVIMPVGEKIDAASDPRQGNMFPPNTQPFGNSALGKAPVVPQKPRDPKAAKKVEAAAAQAADSKPSKKGAKKLEPNWKVMRRDHDSAEVTITTGDEEHCYEAVARESKKLDPGDELFLYRPDGTVAKHQKRAGKPNKPNGKGRAKHEPEARA
jgi:hypothetical protein